MTTSVHIVFRDLAPTRTMDEYIRSHIEYLEAHVPQVLACSVALESPHRHKQQGRHFRVRIDLTVPGAELVVDRCPDDSTEEEDAYRAVDDAFDRALRRVAERGRRLRLRAS
jgi:ribosome-associated translation inhibitor RaiA